MLWRATFPSEQEKEAIYRNPLHIDDEKADFFLSILWAMHKCVYMRGRLYSIYKEDEILYALSLLQSILFWCLDQWDFSILSDFGKSVFLDEDSIFKHGLEKILPQVQNKN